MEKPAATSLGELMGDLLGERRVVERRSAAGFEGRHGLPLPAALADLGAGMESEAKRMFEIDKKKFGAFLSQLRKEKGYTQKDLAQKLFLSDKAVSKWETGVSQS